MAGPVLLLSGSRHMGIWEEISVNGPTPGKPKLRLDNDNSRVCNE